MLHENVFVCINVFLRFASISKSQVGILLFIHQGEQNFYAIMFFIFYLFIYLVKLSCSYLGLSAFTQGNGLIQVTFINSDLIFNDARCVGTMIFMQDLEIIKANSY